MLASNPVGPAKTGPTEERNSMWELSLLAMGTLLSFSQTALSFIASKLGSHRSCADP